MITSELARLVDAIQAEKNLSRDVVIDIIQSAVEAAARKALGHRRQEGADAGQQEGRRQDLLDDLGDVRDVQFDHRRRF